MKNYGYFFILNHIALAVDSASKEAGFKDLVELDMFNRASVLVVADAEPRGRQIANDLTAALYPRAADCVPTVEQRMMLVQALHDAEIEKILGNIRFFVPHAHTREDLISRFGFYVENDQPALFMPYYMRKHILSDTAVFCEGRLTSFRDACSNGTVTENIRDYGLLTAQAYGKDNVPEMYQDLPLF
ncbi:hypothetical protein pEaSNUABM14_00302 [Erwinia phage pEa_SNUABM_14]|uniref:Uncharacterized protein n=1 Tax=Erwinia phage pEa_SNUABM_7 TaxID=2866695 RepID=A0AAE7WUQ7_9CAUD|nr:hypothetical protein MPK74_gp305 [Erwinia phage pEa_SNUABM_7]QYW03602.1 hypothetical protein pEaSNUABM34_00300 [Erwinia phage pEa_SNUABM_34]QYW03943.1 hypothetical protein pEaSNUABM45_00300 [Erwinia phage pEa_SNUABM_45]QYW04284.1 hypothetical protein pEaSNUABM46_00300 [Erwinia phage pEa_SNUABM_46]QYW04627.1 hypothetical protein pEaSNUABM14_00302 [Erwinia phage pEa_SNUABM_14]QYW05315.1 hypothetical protein pEaSNUABM21_00301 [Erwinia phage pEa_SNUABM_21]QYW05655.1 hypothetical protein pEaSNU